MIRIPLDHDVGFIHVEGEELRARFFSEAKITVEDVFNIFGNVTFSICEMTDQYLIEIQISRFALLHETSLEVISDKDKIIRLIKERNVARATLNFVFEQQRKGGLVDVPHVPPRTILSKPDTDGPNYAKDDPL